MQTVLFEERRNTLAFWFGCILVTTGVVLHLPMFLMARDSGYILAGMPMDTGMLLGMAAIVVGIGFWPSPCPRSAPPFSSRCSGASPADAVLASLTRAPQCAGPSRRSDALAAGAAAA